MHSEMLMTLRFVSDQGRSTSERPHGGSYILKWEGAACVSIVEECQTAGF